MLERKALIPEWNLHDYNQPHAMYTHAWTSDVERCDHFPSHSQSLSASGKDRIYLFHKAFH